MNIKALSRDKMVITSIRGLLKKKEKTKKKVAR